MECFGLKLLLCKIWMILFKLVILEVLLFVLGVIDCLLVCEFKVEFKWLLIMIYLFGFLLFWIVKMIDFWL